MTSLPKSLGELRRSQWSEERIARRSVRQELRENLMCKMEKGEALFSGVHGYDDTVLPQIINAILSRHHFILLGLRGQAKSRILPVLAGFMDQQIPVVEGCEIHDNPYAAAFAAYAGDGLPRKVTLRRFLASRAITVTWRNSPRRT